MESIKEYITPSMVTIGLPFVILLYFTIGAITNYRKLKQFKGPPLAAYSNFWIFWQSCRANLYQAEKDALRKYGSPVRFGPNLLITSDPDVVKHMSAPGSKWARGTWYDAMKLDPRLDSVFSTRSEKRHAELKAKEASGYNGRDNDTLEADLDARILDLTGLIRNKYNGLSMDFSEIARFFTLDVLSSIAFGGQPFGFLAENRDLWDYNKESTALTRLLALAINHTTICSILASPVMQYLAAPKVTDKTGMGPALAFARAAVAERYGPNPKVRNDMLNSFKNKGLDQVQCEVEAYLQIIAGSDSTTTLLRCTMFSLVGSPVAYGKLRQEVDDAVAAGQISSPVGKYSEVQKLPYLNACIWEGLRMFPPLFGLKNKLSPPGGDTIKGIYYPEGTEIGLCDDAMCRRTDIFGEDADVFRPERWLEVDVETRNKFTRTVDSIFGSGRFVCLGRHIAMMELHKTFTELMQNFDWAMTNPLKGIDTVSYAVHVQWNMNLIARPRS